jgi:hypothetical protein
MASNELAVDACEMDRMDEADEDVEKREEADEEILPGVRSASDAAEAAVFEDVFVVPTALELRTLRRDVLADRG